jgi:hypothetical protein
MCDITDPLLNVHESVVIFEDEESRGLWPHERRFDWLQRHG